MSNVNRLNEFRISWIEIGKQTHYRRVTITQLWLVYPKTSLTKSPGRKLEHFNATEKCLNELHIGWLKIKVIEFQPSKMKIVLFRGMQWHTDERRWVDDLFFHCYNIAKIMTLKWYEQTRKFSLIIISFTGWYFTVLLMVICHLHANLLLNWKLRSHINQLTLQGFIFCAVSEIFIF